MILKVPTTFVIKKGEIFYYKLDGLKDFDYLVILLANKAIKEKKTLESMFLELTKIKNDYYLLLEKRFKSLFYVSSLESFLEKENEIKAAKEEIRKMIPNSNIVNFKYFEDLKLFLYQNNFLTFKELKEQLKNQINKENNQQFRDFLINDQFNEKKQQETYEYKLNSELTEFSILNLINENNSIILEKIINYTSKESKKLLPNLIEMNYKIPTIKSWDNRLSQLVRSYKMNESTYIELINLEEKIFDNLKLELNTNKEKNFKKYYIIISKFQIFKSIYFVLEKQIHFLEFKDEPIYPILLSFLSNDEIQFDNNFNELFIHYANSKEEFEIIKNKMNPQLNLPSLSSKIDLMVKYKINLFIAKDYIKTSLYNKYLNQNPISYYKYLITFHSEILGDKTFEKEKIALLNNVLIENVDILNIKDKEWIEEFINNKKYLFNTLKEQIAYFSPTRSDVKNFENVINNKIKITQDNGKLLEFKKELNKWKRICNFFVHFYDKNSNFPRDIEIMNERYHKIINIKKRNYSIKKDDYTTYNISNDDLKILSQAKSDYENFLNELKKELNKK